MKRRVLALLVAAAAVLAHGEAAAQTLQARLDRNPIHDDETVRLVVEADTRVDGLRPDIAPLRRDFEVLGQSTTTHVAIENGARTERDRVDDRAGPQTSRAFHHRPAESGSEHESDPRARGPALLPPPRRRAPPAMSFSRSR